ncbi:phosphate uptake regulator PhoU [Methanoplanus sp. FWC-SCC4]|uniref:Phosphate uptake regulator PhoU n=1 Tax=Methanochimaera problematica TaxID=2609417 RepID=A0AA97I3P1_9EURY|nr:phosphate uptake regulator PhoU [Methanoplanus sp. FWC-SCC4]WOF16106.1 phosphate uptake regulator PhoU [Methanoplanus sp. FWC-SCC4]
MDIRKVQMSGGSSYIVSLPKEWVKKSNIHKNDPVGLIVQEDGNLMITPNTSGFQVQKIWEFEVNASTDQNYFLRCMIGAYISGYTSMKIWAHGRLPAFVTERVREFTNMAIGQEVVEESDKTIIIKDLLNPSEMPILNTLNRMSVIVAKMHRDALIALKENDLNLSKNVIARDSDVDRLHWLIGRQSHLIINDLNLSRRMKVSPDMAASYFLISRIIERVGDHATRIAGNVEKIAGKNIPEEIYEKIESVSSESLKVFQMSTDSFFQNDIEKGNSVIELAFDIEEKCREINKEAINYDAVLAIPIVNISDSIRRVFDYSTDICENLINEIVGKTPKM